MALAPLATAGDLEARGVDVTDTDRVKAALDAASAAIREAAGSPISQETSTTTIGGIASQWLRLPTRPVSDVSEVALDGAAVTDYKLVDGGLWRAAGWQRRCGEPSVVTFTATHGYAVVPEDIVQLACDIATAGLLSEGGSHAGLAYESIDDYRVGYLQGSEATASVYEVPPRTRAMLRQRFSGATHVTSEAP